MLDHIIVRQHRRHDPTNPLDIGALVEAMLFYGRTELIVSPAVVAQLATAWTPEGLIEMAEEGFLSLTFRHRNVAIHTEHTGTGNERHRPIVFSIHPSQGAEPIGMERFVPSTFEALVGRRGRARRLANHFYKHIQLADIDDGIADRVRADLLDAPFISGVIRDLVSFLVPEYPATSTLRFEVHNAADGLRVDTDINFQAANDLYHRLVPPSHSSLSPAYLLAYILDAREALETAAMAQAEMATDPAHALVAAYKMNSVLWVRARSDRTIASFQEFLFDDSRALREAINQGRSVGDILGLLRHARRFRGWLRERPPESDLIRQYFRECTAQTWVDRLPTKTARWILFTGLGLAIDVLGAGGIGTATGLAVSAGDAFLLERIMRGWRPSQFVEKELRGFLQSGR